MTESTENLQTWSLFDNSVEIMRFRATNRRDAIKRLLDDDKCLSSQRKFLFELAADDESYTVQRITDYEWRDFLFPAPSSFEGIGVLLLAPVLGVLLLAPLLPTILLWTLIGTVCYFMLKLMKRLPQKENPSYCPFEMRFKCSPISKYLNVEQLDAYLLSNNNKFQLLLN